MIKSRLLRGRIHRRMIVTLASGEVYDGLLVAFDGVVVELAQSALIGTADQAIKPAVVDGVLLLPWDHVAYLQVP